MGGEKLEEKVSKTKVKNWQEYDPKKEYGIKILVCEVCNNHHYHILNIGGKVYAQCGRCSEIYKI